MHSHYSMPCFHNPRTCDTIRQILFLPSGPCLPQPRHSLSPPLKVHTHTYIVVAFGGVDSCLYTAPEWSFLGLRECPSLGSTSRSLGCPVYAPIAEQLPSLALRSQENYCNRPSLSLPVPSSMAMDSLEDPGASMACVLSTLTPPLLKPPGDFRGYICVLLIGRYLFLYTVCVEVSPRCRTFISLIRGRQVRGVIHFPR